MKKKILYITLEGVNSTVFDSQVYELLNSRISIEYDVELLCLQAVNIKWNRENLKKIKKLKQNKIFKVMIIPYIGYKNILSYNIAKKIIKYKISKLSKEVREIIVHCRGQEAGLIASECKTDKTIIYSDIRSVPSEELKDVNYKRSIYFEEIDKKLFENKDIYLNFISDKLFHYYKSIYNIENFNSIIPCFASFESTKNNIINLKDKKLTYLYVGGQQFYQKLEKYDEIMRLSKDKSKWIFCLNGDRNIDFENKIKDIAKIKKINLQILYNLNKDKLDNVYSKSNVGVIFRDNIILNEVACPVKVAEYFSKGLSVCMIGKIGDFYKLIKNDNKLGIAVENIEDLDQEKIESLENIQSYYDINYRVDISNKYSKENCIKEYLYYYGEMK